MDKIFQLIIKSTCVITDEYNGLLSHNYRFCVVIMYHAFWIFYYLKNEQKQNETFTLKEFFAFDFIAFDSYEDLLYKSKFK